MQYTDEAWGEQLGFINHMKHTKNNASDGKEKKVKQFTIVKEKRAQFFCNGKNTVSVRYVDNLERHGGSSLNRIFITTGRAGTAFTTKRNKFEVSTMRAFI